MALRLLALLGAVSAGGGSGGDASPGVPLLTSDSLSSTVSGLAPSQHLFVRFFMNS